MYRYFIPLILIYVFISCSLNRKQVEGKAFSSTESHEKPFDRESNSSWPEDFELIEIKSSADSAIQQAYFHPSDKIVAQPLIISLHTWSGNYAQFDPIADLCIQKNLNYIHPDFRGPNDHASACCSDLVISDIDDAINYALSNSKVLPSEIYLIGVSGGAYVSLCMLEKSKHNINKYSAWVPITDLPAWYEESNIRNNKYKKDILDCTSSENEKLNIEIAKNRSPLYWPTEVSTLLGKEINIYAGIYDGINGSVPITHSINYYNKIASIMGAPNSSLVSLDEKLKLLENRVSLGNFEKIGKRKVFLHKKYGNIQLKIFEGGHEMLPKYALEVLLLP